MQRAEATIGARLANGMPQNHLDSTGNATRKPVAGKVWSCSRNLHGLVRVCFRDPSRWVPPK